MKPFSIVFTALCICCLTLGSGYTFASPEHDHSKARSEPSQKDSSKKKDSRAQGGHTDGEEPHSAEAHDERGHSHDKKTNSANEKDEHGHTHSEGEEEGHSDHEEEAGSPNIGPDKGIIAKSESQGLQLSPEALKNFGIQSIRAEGAGTFTVPTTALVSAGQTTGIYRLRDEFFKLVPVRILKKGQGTLSLEANQVRSGDAIVTIGAAYLRVAELDSEAGESHGHSH